MDQEMLVRKCGSDFKYCNGDCDNCHINKFTYATSLEEKNNEKRN